MKEILPVYETRLVRRGRRKTNNPITDSKVLFALVGPYFSGLDREHMVILYFDSSLRPLGYKVESIGSTAQCLVDLRLVVRDALLAGAMGIALAHNHPSDNCQPSPEDQKLTERIAEACSLVELRLLDHLIITLDSYFSFADHGLIRSKPTEFYPMKGGPPCTCP